MKGSLWLAALASVIGLAAFGGGAALGQEKVELKAFEKDAKPFYQTLKTETEQKLSVQGMEVKQEQKQTFYFEWTPEGKKDGKYNVKQKIIGLKMNITVGGNNISYDSTDPNQPQNPMTQFFKELLGTTFTLTIDPDKMKVTEVKGVKEMVEKLTKVNQSMKPLLEKILSEDAVKQMANPIFGFLPAEGKLPEAGKSWEQKQTLDMGPIGTYVITNTYKVAKDAEKDKNKVKINMDTNLTYSAPNEAELKGSKLPFKILKGELTTKKDGGKEGFIIFNKEKGLIERSELSLALKGNLKVEVAGSPNDVTLEQTQNTWLTTSMESPLPDQKKKS